MTSNKTSPTALSPLNLAIGAGVSLFEVTTLGQPLEVLKTHMASNRSDNLRTAISKTYSQRGGFKGFYQGLIPWAWIESATTGAILLFTSSSIEQFAVEQGGIGKGTAGLLGGMGGGASQAYLAMGVCTTMKTAEITRMKQVVSPVPGEPLPRQLKVPSTWSYFLNTYRHGGIAAINKGVNAVALRQVTNWGSRIGIARAAEEVIKDARGYSKQTPLGVGDKVVASAIGGILGCWNHPIEVVRVEMQSLKQGKKSVNLNMLDTLRLIYQENGLAGLFRGVTPRIALSTYRTICLVSLGDYVKNWSSNNSIERRGGGGGQGPSFIVDNNLAADQERRILDEMVPTQ